MEAVRRFVFVGVKERHLKFHFKHFTVQIIPNITILKLLRESLREVKVFVILNNN
jgi:hypothetical protein